jgi:aromatic ring-cleaving dioxygenase
MTEQAQWHAHTYFTDVDRAPAAALRERFRADPRIRFVGRMADGPVGPHPIPQYEIHFLADAREAVIEAITAAGLRALVHPLTHDDLADHTTLGHWIGEPLALDLSVLDPPGVNQGVARFGASEF